MAPLGVGGMGEVYRARDPRLDRSVAIKILFSPHGASPTQLERFQCEAQSLARISHPHICTLHDVGQQDGVAFLVMELLEGETLAERLERGPIPIDQALVIAAQIAEALNALHRKDIVHRDLKPSNVMLTTSGARAAMVRWQSRCRMSWNGGLRQPLPARRVMSEEFSCFSRVTRSDAVPQSGAEDFFCKDRQTFVKPRPNVHGPETRI